MSKVGGEEAVESGPGDGRERAEKSSCITGPQNTSERSPTRTRAVANPPPSPLCLLAQWMAMSNDDPSPTNTASANVPRPPPAPKRSVFDIPPALKRIFDRFPLVTYAENERPLRAPQRPRDGHVLYVFATVEGASKGRASFNPACLKWQVGSETL